MAWLGLCAVALTLVAAGVFARLRGSPRAARPRATLRAVLLLALAVLAATGPALLRVSGAPQAFAGFVVLLLAPGAALLGFLRLGDLLTELTLALATSLMVLALLTGVMVLSGHWEPNALYVVLAVTSAPLLGWHGAGSLAPASDPPGEGAR